MASSELSKTMLEMFREAAGGATIDVTELLKDLLGYWPLQGPAGGTAEQMGIPQTGAAPTEAPRSDGAPRVTEPRPADSVQPAVTSVDLSRVWEGLSGVAEAVNMPVQPNPSRTAEGQAQQGSGSAWSLLGGTAAPLLQGAGGGLLQQMAKADGGGGGVLKTLGTVLTSGLGMMPVIKAIAGLFGGGDDEPPALVRYAPPASLNIAAANSRNGGAIRMVDNGQGGRPRVVESSTDAGPSSSQALPQIVVQVNAMDSRSFLDHSDEIARAVREAMLNMHSLNDLVSEI
jgi:hypothetical protein